MLFYTILIIKKLIIILKFCSKYADKKSARSMGAGSRARNPAAGISKDGPPASVPARIFRLADF